MVAETELQKGQLNPAAQPVNAFLQPANYQVAQPGQIAEMPGVRGVDLVGTGGTPSVQGYNHAAQLAEALAPFSKAAVEAAQQAGLQFAQWQARKGEADFMEAYRKAQLQVDQSTEVGESSYAAASRAVYAKDKPAGLLMWAANPYRQMGAERARSRLAGQEIEWKMAGVEGQMTPKDYEAPDQGFAKLQRLRAGLIAQVTQAWGVDANSPGFQKYTAPAIEKASERSSTRLMEDRQKYFDETRPKQLASLLANTILLEKNNGSFEFQNNTYSRATTPPELYWQAFGNKMDSLARDFLSKAGPGGMTSKWAREAYQILSAEADYSDNTYLSRAIGLIKTAEPLRGPDGKPVIGANGAPVFLTWRDLYGQETIDSKIKYEQAGFASRAAQAKDVASRAVAEMDLAAGSTPIGPERQAIGDSALAQFIQREEARTGQPISPVQRLEIKRQWSETNKLAAQLAGERVDPALEVNYLAGLEQKFGTQFNAATERQEVQRLAASMAVNDPQRAAKFQAEAFRQIEQKEKEVKDFSGYTSARDKVINDNVNTRVLRNYPQAIPGGVDTYKVDREESERRQRLAYTTHVNNRIREKEAQLGRKLNDNEVRATTQIAIEEYGKSDPDALQYLYPGSQAYPNSPSVDPYRTIRPVPLGPDGRPKATTQGGTPSSGARPAAPAPTTYSTQGLDEIPNRSVVLRQYRTMPVMDLTSLRNVVLDGIDGKPLPLKFERAWRDAGAPSAYDFLTRQLQFYPNYKPEWTPAEMNRLKGQQQASARTERALISRAAMAPAYPSISALIGGGLNVLTGASAASAATREVGDQRPFSSASLSDDLRRFRRAITGQESGGRYAAVNPDSGALGIGQVMPENVGPWTQKYLGRRLTPEQFLANTAAQDAVINGRFRDMFADQRRAGFTGEQMVRRAAAVWYSGRANLWNDTTPQVYKGRTYPSIAEYTQAIWDRYRR